MGLLSGCSDGTPTQRAADVWSDSQLAVLRSLSLASLGAPPTVASNRFADDPRAARLGHQLFFDPGLSADGTVSCASCHQPGRYFTDGERVSRGLGRTARNAPTVVGAAYSPWQFWDGRRDSLWSQALAPLEAASELGNDRLRVVRRVTQDERYRDAYRALFGDVADLSASAGLPEAASPYGDPALREAWSRLPAQTRQEIDRAFSNIGKALAAYERRLLPGPARFDHYVERVLAGDLEAAARWLSDDEAAGLRLFVDAGRTQCLRCHNGPLLTNQSFHDIATSRLGPVPDLGRFVGIQSLLLDPFNCLGPFSDAAPESCGELRFLERREIGRDTGAFKTPTLRGLANTAPYFHDGSVPELLGVMQHYRDPPDDPGSELLPLALDDREVGQLVAFLASFEGVVAADDLWLGAPADGDAMVQQK